MSDFLSTWELTRGRLEQSIQGLSQEQLNWWLHPDVLTIAEMTVHVAGVEASFSLQLQGLEAEGDLIALQKSATDGSINDNPFPYSVEEMTPEFVAGKLAVSKELVRPLLENPEPWRSKEIKSALGPMIDGTGAFVRLAAHSFYHQGQVHVIKTAPGFPS